MKLLVCVFLVIDTALWDQLQKQFPSKIEARLKGLPSLNEEFCQQKVSHRISEEGQIRKEFENDIENFELERKKIR